MAKKQSRSPRPGASTRPSRVQEAMREELAKLLSDGTIKDPRLESAMLTVTEVRITSDLQLAKVFVSAYGEPEAVAEAFRGLWSATGVLRREVTRRLALRVAPELTFELDESIENGARIEALLRSIAEERDARGEGEEPS
ncbi:MAG: 30S ribosome-binding factor RbfA [Deltaproteobacteria bacterium]|nr:30S ribosome-binding factor RbfA [Deltaproteobacteria bacterium]